NRALEAGLDWFFSNESEGIIFEDDCVPSLDYFNYAQTLLNKYRDEEKVMMICGTNFQGNGGGGGASYYFSVYPTWGWATWRRAWVKYDRNMGAFDNFFQTKKIDRILDDPEQKKYWMSFYKKLKRGKFSFMDSKWQFAIWNNEGVCIIPNNNLIQNIGFGGDATNTFEDVGMSISRQDLKEIVHPKKIEINRIADDFFYNKVHKKSLLLRIKFKLRILFRKYFI
ncbi:MAG TPA: hypothetical protein PLY70_17195, partial [Saprospiraceae bacterium]|nr:hypothetical protein [Saprospiraceae bacterium]